MDNIGSRTDRDLQRTLILICIYAFEENIYISGLDCGVLNTL